MPAAKRSLDYASFGLGVPLGTVLDRRARLDEVGRTRQHEEEIDQDRNPGNIKLAKVMRKNTGGRLGVPAEGKHRLHLCGRQQTLHYKQPWPCLVFLGCQALHSDVSGPEDVLKDA